MTHLTFSWWYIVDLYAASIFSVLVGLPIWMKNAQLVDDNDEPIDEECAEYMFA